MHQVLWPLPPTPPGRGESRGGGFPPLLLLRCTAILMHRCTSPLHRRWWGMPRSLSAAMRRPARRCSRRARSCKRSRPLVSQYMTPRMTFCHIPGGSAAGGQRRRRAVPRPHSAEHVMCRAAGVTPQRRRRRAVSFAGDHMNSSPPTGTTSSQSVPSRPAPLYCDQRRRSDRPHEQQPIATAVLVMRDGQTPGRCIPRPRDNRGGLGLVGRARHSATQPMSGRPTRPLRCRR